MAPNHLIDKWEREILMAVPGAWVRTFNRSDENAADDSFKEVMQYIDACRQPRATLAPLPDVEAGTCDVSTDIGPHSVNGVLVDRPYSVETIPAKKRRRDRSDRGRWRKPWCPEWVIIGRNQAKQEPDWQALGERRFAFAPGVKSTRLVGMEEVTGPDGKPVRRMGETVMRAIYRQVLTCPKCGCQVFFSPDELAKKQENCRIKTLREIGTEDRKGGGGLDVIAPIPSDLSESKYGDTVKHKDRSYKVVRCNEPLWQWTPRPRKWAPARLIHKQARGLFDYMILDEMHEEKEAHSGQAVAAGKIMRSARRILGLTGTLIGGYAHHLFPLLMRMAPHSLVQDGFEWGGEMGFTKLYGRIDTTIVTKYGKGGGSRQVSRGRGQTSMRKDVDEDKDEKKDVKPGVMPTFFGKHLIDKAIFIGLDEMADDLPELVDDDRSLIAVDMDGPLKDEYDRVQVELVSENTRLLQKGSSKLLSAMLRTLLEYPDKPFGWKGPFPNTDAVGYFVESSKRTVNSWANVCQPADLDESVVYAKEQALYELCMREAAEGRQVWVYCTQTGKRDVQTRLAGILKRGGLKVKVLRSASVDTYSREAWIKKNGPDLDVAISHPELVSTGLDFFDKAGTFNFCTIAFFEGDYRVNLIRQAGRRHWRIGQQRECRTYYLYYRGTMQERQVQHVGAKYAASKSLEGKFSAEGLAALSDGGLAMTRWPRRSRRRSRTRERPGPSCGPSRRPSWSGCTAPVPWARWPVPSWKTAGCPTRRR
jgi:hypothetical protein